MIDFPRPAGKPTFTEDWFKWFFTRLTLPEGYPVQWAGHLLLMTQEFFRPELIHLLVLIPKGNWKTTWEAALADWHLLTVKAPRIYAGAADKEQAKELYQFAATFIEGEPELSERLLVRESTLEIRTRSQRGIFKILASDDSRQGGKKQGKNATLTEGDELHAWENDNLFVDLRSGGFKRREAARMAGDPLWWTIGKMGTITTAGWDQEGVLGLLRSECLQFDQTGGSVERGLRVLEDGSVERHEDGRLTIARSASGGTVMLEWALTKDDDWTDFDVVKLANPAPTVTRESLVDAYESLRPNVFKRYRTGQWTLAFESWLPEGAWEALLSPSAPTVEHRLWNGATTAELDAYVASLYPPDTQITAAIDMARYRDCAAVTTVGPSPDGKLLPRTVVWRSGGPDNPIPYEPVYRVARQLCTRYAVQALGLDPKYLDEMYDTLEGEGIPVEGYPQANERVCPADANLRKAILTDKTLEHDGDPILAAHVNAAVAQEVGSDAFKLTKSKGNGPPIDACRALSMAYDLAGNLPGDFWVVVR